LSERVELLLLENNVTLPERTLMASMLAVVKVMLLLTPGLAAPEFDKTNEPLENWFKELSKVMLLTVGEKVEPAVVVRTKPRPPPKVVAELLRAVPPMKMSSPLAGTLPVFHDEPMPHDLPLPVEPPTQLTLAALAAVSMARMAVRVAMVFIGLGLLCF
jgi:hypothetical protein